MGRWKPQRESLTGAGVKDGAAKPMGRGRRELILLAIAIWAGAGVLAAGPAAAAECAEHFAGGLAPRLLNPRLAGGSRALCFRSFAVLHSARTRTPLYSAEHLTREGLAAARGLPRDSEFHAEPGLPESERAELEDYARSGYDRGHMSPSGDMPDADAQQESFSLANMVPQAPKLNRGLWEGIERSVRRMAGRQGELYVVTGPIFQGSELQTVGHVLVPSHVFKAVFDPRQGLAAAYVAKNVDDAPWAVVTMQQLADLTGLTIFPALRPDAAGVALALPKPMPTRRATRGRGYAR